MWYRFLDCPFPVQVGAVLKDEETGEVKGFGLYIRIPTPWEEYLTPWPSAEEKGATESPVSKTPSRGKSSRSTTKG